MWLPASALDCYEGDAALRSWLRTPGLLTERVRAASGATFALQVFAEDTRHGEHRRAIALGPREAPWIYAETAIPDATLAREPWLARIGTVSLGEALTAHGDVTRSGFSYARLTPDVPLLARAAERAPFAPQPLWVRRSEFAVRGAPLTVQEVFLPAIGRGGAAAGAPRVAWRA
ncbi:MAG: chorismate lyase [Steroidobacteraceae bacterium]|nr:chorismate lyase [Steroidobacteraceae bacterium]